MRPNEGSFFIQGKTLNSENSLIRLHSVIPSSYSLQNRIIPFIWGSFRHSNLIPVRGQLKIIPCRRYTAFANEKIGCCLYKRQHLIISFLRHSSVIPTSFHEQYWTVLYLNSWMTEWWRNDRHLRIHFFSPSPKTPPFHLIPSFHITFEWQRMKITMGR